MEDVEAACGGVFACGGEVAPVPQPTGRIFKLRPVFASSMKKVVMPLDKPNLNGRIYPRDVMEKALRVFNIQVGMDRAIGYLGQENVSIYPSLTEASHIINELHIDEDNNLVATVTPLDTPNGRIANKLLQCDSFHLATRGIGKIENNVVSDFELISVDVVAGPPFEEPDRVSSLVKALIQNVEETKNVPIDEKPFIVADLIVHRFDMCRDGGTLVFYTNLGDFYVDRRIGTQTPECVYDHYPTESRAKLVSPQLEHKILSLVKLLGRGR